MTLELILYIYTTEMGSLPANAGDMSQEHPLEKKMATHSSILAWRIPWTEEADGLDSDMTK